MAAAVLVALMAPTFGGGVVTADHAPPSYDVVGEPGRFLVDASSDGRFVLTADSTNDLRRFVVDRATGSSTEVGVHALMLSGDGRRVIFVSTERLVRQDTDAASDVYSKDVASGTVRLLTVGAPGWAFIGFAGVDSTGDQVVARGVNGALFSYAPFHADGVTTRELGTEVEPGTPQPNASGQVYAISDDGRFAVFSTSRGCQNCPRLWRQDLTTGELVDLGPAQHSELVLSSDGRHMAAVHPGTARVLVGTTDGQPLRVLTTEGSPSSLSISADGSGLVWTEVRGGGLPKGRMWTAPGEPQPLTGPLGHEAVNRVVLTADGLTVFMGLGDPGAQGPARNIVAARTVPPHPALASPVLVPSGPESVYVARTPHRILDTRAAIGTAGTARPPAGATIPLSFPADLPDDATAIAVQIAATDGVAPGYVSVIPSGATPGLTANLNVERPGQVISNMAVVPLASGGANVYTQSSTHLVVDLLGWWVPSDAPTAAGRHVGATPSRILDTRPESLVNSTGDKPGAGSTLILDVTGLGGVPETGVAAVALNVAADAAESAGYVQVAPADGFVVGSSATLNVGVGSASSATTIVPVDSGGRIAIHTQSRAHLVVDVSGWFTDASALPSASGKFVPVAPARFIDSRAPGIGIVGRLEANSRLAHPARGPALVGNLAVTATAGPGFVQLGPAGTMVSGSTASINFVAGSTVSNAFVVAVDTALGIYAYAPTHVVVDVAGFMT